LKKVNRPGWITYLFAAVIIGLPLMVSAQGNGNTTGGWKFTTLDGEVFLKGTYRDRESWENAIYELQKSAYFSGGLKLNTKSYIWHPNFLLLELGGEYAPESNMDEYLVSPDFSEVRTLKGLNGGVTLFNNKPVTLNTWGRWSDTYSSRENLTNIQTNSLAWGSSLYLRSKFLPLNLTYSSNKWDQNEIDIGRTYITEQENFEASTQKSFGQRDQNELRYTHDRYYRREPSLFETENFTDNIRLTNSIFLDKNRNNSFRSLIYDYNRRGSQQFHIFNVTENIISQINKKLRLSGSYNLYNQQQEMQASSQNRITANVNHKLFESLTTNLFYEYSNIYHTLYHELRNNMGGSVNYTKKIGTGKLNLMYSYSNLRNIMDNDPVQIPVYNEQYILKDGEITMLAKPYIIENSVVVRDASGSIIYQPLLDYILIPKGTYLEIQRVPGGLIENNSIVFIDYVCVLEGSYKYNAISNNMYAGLLLFKGFLEIYYRGSYLGYRNVEKTDLLVLNYIEQNTFGAKLDFGISQLGAEYEDHNSTITPYKLMHYYLNFQKRIKKFTMSANGNYNDYDMVDEAIRRQYFDVSGGAAYEFTANTKLDVDAGYRKQIGPGIDLDLLRLRTEFKVVIRQLYLNIGADLYRRVYLGERTNFNSAYLQITRKF